MGQCGYDDSRIGQLLQEACNAALDRSDDLAGARLALQGGRYDLVLVNRLLDRDRSSGLTVIENILSESGTPAVMLVSDLPEAQAEAERLGALPGFGKAALHRPETIKRIKAALRSPE